MARSFWKTSIPLVLLAGVETGCASWKEQTVVPVVASHVPVANPPRIVGANIPDEVTVAKPRFEFDLPAIPTSMTAPPPNAPAVTTGPRKVFELPAGLPGAEVPGIAPLRFTKDTSLDERIAAIKKAYPELPAIRDPFVIEGTPLSLAEVQQMAIAGSPTLTRADRDVEVAMGNVITAGLYPNPTVGWQADQWQPGNKPSNSSGQQGAYINQLIKTCGKLSLAKAVAQFDYQNAIVARRRAEIDLNVKVRQAYYGILLASEGIRVNKLLIQVADEVYQLQLNQLKAGEAAGYEPLQLFSQAIQARAALTQAQSDYKSRWAALASALGQPKLPMAPLLGSVDAPPPTFNAEILTNHMVESHTDLLTARNTLTQAQANLTLQRKIPKPDLQTNFVTQHDNASGNNQFSVQIGVALPVYDRNQGNIYAAQATIGRAIADLAAKENDLRATLTDAVSRYESAARQANDFRTGVLPNLTRAYRGIISRYQQETDKVQFNDIVTAQIALSQGLATYLTNLGLQWQAAVDVYNAAQVDEESAPR